MRNIFSRLWPIRLPLVVGVVFLLSLSYFWWRLAPSPRFILGGDVKVRLLDVSPDGKLIAVSEGDQLQVWQVASGLKTATFSLPGESVEHAIFTPDSQRLIANCFNARKQERHHAHIFKVNGKSAEAVLPLGTILDHAWAYLQPRSFLVSPDSKHLAYLSPHPDRVRFPERCLLKLWDLASAQEKADLADIIDPFRTPLAFSPDNRSLAAGISRMSEKVIQVKLWDVATGRETHTLPVPPTKGMSDSYFYGVDALVFTTDGQSIIGMVSPHLAGCLEQVHHWNLATSTLQKSLNSKSISTRGQPSLRMVGSGQQVLIEAYDRLMSFTYLCEMSGAEFRLQESFGTLPLMTHDAKRMVVSNQLSGAGALFGMIAAPGENRKEQRPGLSMLDLATLQKRDVCTFSWLDGIVMPAALSSDDSAVALTCHYQFLFTDRWYKPILTLLLEPERQLHVYAVSSGWCLARLPGTEARFTSDGNTLITFENQSPILNSLPGGIIRIYDYPFNTPLLSILVWALLPTIVFVLLVAGWRAWRSRKKAAVAPSRSL